jgi:hypothetical protein
MIREEPYLGLNVVRPLPKGGFRKTDYKVLHGCRQLVP